MKEKSLGALVVNAVLRCGAERSRRVSQWKEECQVVDGEVCSGSNDQGGRCFGKEVELCLEQTVSRSHPTSPHGQD